MAPAISTADVSDRDAVVALWHRCQLTRPWNDPEGDFSRAMAGAASTILVARESEGGSDSMGHGAVLASIMVGFDGHRGWVYYLGVDPAYRQQGLGRQMMLAAEAWLSGIGCPKIQLMIRNENKAAIGFYHALGYDEQEVVTVGRWISHAPDQTCS